MNPALILRSNSPRYAVYIVDQYNGFILTIFIEHYCNFSAGISLKKGVVIGATSFFFATYRIFLENVYL